MADLWSFDYPKPHDEAQAERNVWFSKIRQADDWKMPVDAWIDATDFEQCNSACIWFTGSALNTIDRAGARVHVVADGYYNAIGA